MTSTNTSNTENTENPMCSICLEDITTPVQPFICEHKFHQKCTSIWTDDYSNYTCPNCRVVKKPIFENPQNQYWYSRTKKVIITETTYTRYWSNGNVKLQINLVDNTGNYYYSDNYKTIPIDQIEERVLDKIKKNDIYALIL